MRTIIMNQVQNGNSNKYYEPQCYPLHPIPQFYDSRNGNGLGFDQSAYETPLTVPINSSYENNNFQGQQLLQKLELSGRVPSREKFRRMICQTYVCCGGCPYNERCVFLHDDRVELKGFKTRPNRQGKVINGCKDSFYWPDMPKEYIYQKLDYLGLPSVNQKYDIPDVFADEYSLYHDRAVFSMWYHFVAFCSESNSQNCDSEYFMDSPFSQKSFKSVTQPWLASPCERNRYLFDNFDDPMSKCNRFCKGINRLDVFVKLSSYETNIREHLDNLKAGEYYDILNISDCYIL